MSHAVKLVAFFIISVALHGAGLWAAAGRYEPHEPDVPAGVAIVDRDLFFRQAERISTQASSPVSATDRITPRSAGTVRPSQPGESLAGAPAEAAGEAEPERRTPASPVGAMARLDLSTVEPAPPPRREARAPDGIDAERREPMRMSGIDATAPVAAMRPQAQPSPPAPVPARTSETLAPSGAERRASLVIAPPLRPSGDVRPAARAPAPEPVTRTAADAPMHGSLDTIARAPAVPTRIQAPAPAAMAHVERGEPAAAQTMFSAEAPRLAPPGTQPADLAARDEIASRPADRPDVPVAAPAPSADAPFATAAVSPAAAPVDAAAAPTAVPAQVARDRPELRGTLPAPLLAARQPQAARHEDAPTAAPAPPRPQAEGVRLRPSLPDDTAPDRATVAAAPAEAVRPSGPTAPPSAAPQQLAALDPETPARRLESSDLPSGRNDPADRFTRAYQGGECFFPLRLASHDGAAIRGYGLQADSVDMFRQAFAEALGAAPTVDWRPLTDAQCAGISFTRLVLGDSAPNVRIALERKELGLGQDLAGRVTGSRLEFVTLLVVDDSGVVHNVLDHLTPEGADLAFAIPVQPVDDGTDKVQLLMAVGASRPLPALESTAPVHSDDFFPALRDQAVDTGAVLELGLEDFVILGRGS